MVVMLNFAHEDMPRDTFAILGVVGLINSGLIFVMSRKIHSALAALAIAVSPPGTLSLGGNDSMSESFWR